MEQSQSSKNKKCWVNRQEIKIWNNLRKIEVLVESPENDKLEKSWENCIFAESVKNDKTGIIIGKCQICTISEK